MASNNVVEVTEAFKADVKMWLRLTQQKSQVAKDMKLLNGKLKELKDSICEYMASNRLDACNVRGGKLQLYTSKSKEPLNKETIKSSIANYMATKEGRVPNDPMAGEMADFIVSNRAVKEKHSLRRSGGPKAPQGDNDTATSELREQPAGEEDDSSQDENEV